MHRDQIRLTEMPLEQNRAFLRALYGTEDLEQARKWFDKLDCSVSAARQNDPDMTLEAFLDLMTDSFPIVLQTGSPFPNQIGYCASSIGGKPERFALVECPYNEHNYGAVSRLFSQVFGHDIQSTGIPKEGGEPGKSLSNSQFNDFYSQLDMERRINTGLFECGKLDLEAKAETNEPLTNRDYGIYDYSFCPAKGGPVRLTASEIAALHDITTWRGGFYSYQHIFDDWHFFQGSWCRTIGELLRDSLIHKGIVEVTDPSQRGGYRVNASGEFTARVVKLST